MLGVWLGEPIQPEKVDAHIFQDLHQDCLPDLHGREEMRSSMETTAKNSPRGSLRVHPSRHSESGRQRLFPKPQSTFACAEEILMKKTRTDLSDRSCAASESRNVSQDRCNKMPCHHPVLDSACASRLRAASRTTHRREAHRREGRVGHAFIVSHKTSTLGCGRVGPRRPVSTTADRRSAAAPSG